MEGYWKVWFEGTEVGRCCVERKGLYYHFSSRCNCATDQIYRLRLSCNDKSVDIGVFVPCGDYLLLEKRIAIKNLPVGEPVFTVKLCKQTEREEGQFIPINENGPVLCLKELHRACFAVRDGVPGILIREEGCV